MGAPVLLYLSSDAEHRAANADALRELGFEVVEDEPSAQGPDLVRRAHPDGTILDLADPDGPGFEHAVALAVWLRDASPWRDDPTFAERAGPDAVEALAGRAPGLRWVGDELVAAVKEAFKGQMGFMVPRRAAGTRGVQMDGDIMIV